MRTFLFIFLLIFCIYSLVKAEDFTNDKWQKRIDVKAYKLKELGRSALSRGETERAIELYQKALNIKNDYYIGALNLGMAYSEKKDQENAILWLKKALSVAKKEEIKDPTTYNALGYIYMEKGDIKKARSLYKDGIKIDQKHPKLLTNYGILLFREGKYNSAIEKLQIASDEGYAPAQKNLEQIKRMKEAIDQAHKYKVDQKQSQKQAFQQD